MAPKNEFYSRRGATALHVASLHGHLVVAKWLARTGGLEDRLKDGRSPLHAACKRGHLEIAQWLVASGHPLSVKTVCTLSLHRFSLLDVLDKLVQSKERTKRIQRSIFFVNMSVSPFLHSRLSIS